MLLKRFSSIVFCLLSSYAYCIEDLTEQKIRGYLLSHPEVIEQALQKHKENVLQVNAKNITEAVSRNAPIVVANESGEHNLIAFIDYRCGACRVGNAAINEFIRSHPEVRLVIKPLPILGDDSVLASTLLYDAQKKKSSKKVHNALMDVKRLGRTDIEKIAGQYHLPFPDDIKALEKHWSIKELKMTYLQSTTLENTSTPFYLLSTGRRVEIIRGAPSASSLDAMYRALIKG